ncbi:MAG: PilZ domain-containing protein [Micavibrio sp.]|nr:PilZ domain-containing protein [Micavibrio sp.]
MFDQFLAKLNAFETAYRDEVIDTRRRFMRHQTQGAEVMLKGRPYDLRDWSLDGVLFETPRTDWNLGGVYYDFNPVPKLKVGETIKLALRFHILNETIEVPLEAQILRMGTRGTVARFNDLSAASRRKMQRVLDLHYAEGFLQSQVQAEAA